jgi:hypothetical protein
MTAKSKTTALRAVACDALNPIPRQKVRLHTIDDVRLEMGKVYRDVRMGKLEATEGTKLAYILGQMVKVFELSVIEARINALEANYEQKP